MLVLNTGDKIQGDATVAAEVDFTIHGTDSNTLMYLGNGQLPNTIGDLFESSQCGTDTISTIILVNTGAAINYVNLYITRPGGTARRIIPVDLPLEAGAALHLNSAGMSYFK